MLCKSFAILFGLDGCSLQHIQHTRYTDMMHFCIIFGFSSSRWLPRFSMFCLFCFIFDRFKWKSVLMVLHSGLATGPWYAAHKQYTLAVWWHAGLYTVGYMQVCAISSVYWILLSSRVFASRRWPRALCQCHGHARRGPFPITRIQKIKISSKLTKQNRKLRDTQKYGTLIKHCGEQIDCARSALATGAEMTFIYVYII